MTPPSEPVEVLQVPLVKATDDEVLSLRAHHWIRALNLVPEQVMVGYAYVIPVDRVIWIRIRDNAAVQPTWQTVPYVAGADPMLFELPFNMLDRRPMWLPDGDLVPWSSAAAALEDPGFEALLSKAFEALMDVVFDINRDNGWFDTERSFEADIALLHSEVSEAFEAWRKGQSDEFPGDVYDSSSLPAELGADVAIRWADSCKRMEIDAAGAIVRKLRHNRNRGYRHGNRRV